jgi:nucleoside-diphosphate-sugar epimerase
MKIVVTGALGHIGSRLIRELPVTFPEAQIVMIDDMSAQRYCSLFDLPTDGNYSFVEGDVLEYDLEKVTEGAEVAVHLAAITDAAGSFEIREKVEYENFTASKRVAEACLKIVSLGNSRGLRFVTCRFGTICGVSPGMRFHTAVNKFCWQAVLGQPLTVWTTAYDQKRPYLDLTEAVEALKFIISHDLFDGRVYNVLTANLTVRDIVDMIRQKMGDVEVQFVESPIMNQLSYEVLSKRFKSAGFEFHGDLEKAIKETIELLR